MVGRPRTYPVGQAPKSEHIATRFSMAVPEPTHHKVLQVRQLIVQANPYAVKIEKVQAVDTALDIALIVMNDPSLHKAVLDQLQALKTRTSQRKKG